MMNEQRVTIEISRGVNASVTGLKVNSLWKQLYNTLKMPSQEGRLVVLQYSNATRRYVWTPVVNRYWVRWTVSLLSSGFWQVTNYAVYYAAIAVDDDDVGITYSGTWDSFPLGGALGGETRRSMVQGDYLEFSVTGTTEIDLAITKQANVGYGYVTINGAVALANGSGLLDDGSGHRYFDGYAAAQLVYQKVNIASGLDVDETYVVRVTNAGLKREAATETRVYFEGYLKDALQLTSGGAFVADVTLTLQAGLDQSAIEYAYSYKPAGASAYQFTGSTHLNEVITAVSWTDGEGNALTVSEGATCATAAEVVLSLGGTARHSQTGTMDHANVICRTTFDGEGVEVYHRHEWLTLSSVQVAYVGMCPSMPSWTTKGYIPFGQVIELTGEGVYKGAIRNRMAMMWNPSLPWVIWLYLPDLVGVDQWSNPGSCFVIQDASVNNKIYARRNYLANVLYPQVGEVWTSTHRVYLTYYADAADLPPLP